MLSLIMIIIFTGYLNFELFNSFSRPFKHERDMQ